MTLLVDSDILIEVSRARNQEILLRWTQLARSDNAILYSPISAAELWAGARPSEHEPLTRLFSSLLCASINEEIGRQAGHYLRQYSKSHGLELADALIAATSVINGAELWTRNRRHYPMKDLSLY